jgi:hypothetical protein
MPLSLKYYCLCAFDETLGLTSVESVMSSSQGLILFQYSAQYFGEHVQ